MNDLIRKSEKKISVVIIDSGIDENVADLDNYIKKSTGYRVNHEGYISEFSGIKTNGIHGTSVALVIRDICRNVELTSINILNENLSTDSRVMIYAMNEALKLEPDIIHMSLGTTVWRFRSYIKEIVKIATENNIIIVSACNNFGLRSYPACLKEVIGVKSFRNKVNSKYHYYKQRKYYCAPHLMIDIEGADKIKGWQRMNGTSIAAAYITGHIANIMYKDGLVDISDIKESLNNKK